MYNRSIRPKEIKKEIIALNNKLKQLSFNKVSYHEFLQFLKKEQVTFDGARRDTKINLKMMMICCHYIKTGEEKEVQHLLTSLGEEDINLPLLVNVENQLRIRFFGKAIPTLINEIRVALVSLLQDSTYEKADRIMINAGIKKFIEKTPLDRRGFLLYTHVHRKVFLELESGREEDRLRIEVKFSSSSSILSRIASDSDFSSKNRSSKSESSVPSSPVSEVSNQPTTPSSEVVSSPSFETVRPSFPSPSSPRMSGKR